MNVQRGFETSLGKVQLDRPNQTPLQEGNFYLRRKKYIYSTQNCMHYKAAFLIFNFDFHFFLNIEEILAKKPVKIFN